LRVERGWIGRSIFCAFFILLNAEMETSKNTEKCGSSKLIVMSVLEPKDELDEVKFPSKS